MVKALSVAALVCLLLAACVPIPVPILVTATPEPTTVPTADESCEQLKSRLYAVWGDITKEDIEIIKEWAAIQRVVIDRGGYGGATERARLRDLWMRVNNNIAKAQQAEVPREFRQYQRKWVESQDCFLEVIDAAIDGDEAAAHFWIEKEIALGRESLYAMQDALDACQEK